MIGKKLSELMVGSLSKNSINDKLESSNYERNTSRITSPDLNTSTFGSENTTPVLNMTDVMNEIESENNNQQTPNTEIMQVSQALSVNNAGKKLSFENTDSNESECD